MEQIADITSGIKRKTLWCSRNVKREKTTFRTMLTAIALTSSLFVGPPTAYAGDIYVRQAGVPFPDGSQSNPYQIVEQAIFKAKTSPGSTIWISAGKYYERFTAATPSILRSIGGSVFIGDVDYRASTTLDILTLNTCLFGTVVPLDPNWQDAERAVDIGNILGGLTPRPDVVGLQEVWDWLLFNGGIAPRSGYPHGGYGGDSNCHPLWVDIYNSGLGLLSSFGLTGFAQVCWDECYETQCFASKGYVRANLEKDGFSILVFNLHTQAYPTAEDKAVRNAQINQLVSDIRASRMTHPFSVVFVIGDFNIMGESDEYWQTLIGLLGFGGIGGKDAYANGPATYSKSNPLALYMADNWASDGNYPFPPDNQRLDYIFCIPSLTGFFGVVPTHVEVLPLRSRNLTEDGLTTNEKSDHWSVRGQFKLVLK